jgi:hypothetical protein
VHWTLQAPDGEFNVRIASGLIVGENAQGDFELAPTQQTALVRFEVDAGTVRIHLVSRDWTFSRNDRMVGDSVRSERAVELHLPNNVIRIVGGENPAAEPDHVELTRRVSMKWLLPTPQRADSRTDAVEVPAVQVPDEIAEAHILQPPPALLEGADDAPARVPDLDPQHDPATTIEPVASPAQLPNARRRRTLGPVTAALIGVGGGVAIALLYQAFTKSTTQSVESRSSAVQTPRVSPSPQAEERLTTIEPIDHAAVAEGTIERSPAPKPAAAPASARATSVGSSASDV